MGLLHGPSMAETAVVRFNRPPGAQTEPLAARTVLTCYNPAQFNIQHGGKRRPPWHPFSTAAALPMARQPAVGPERYLAPVASLCRRLAMRAFLREAAFLCIAPLAAT